MQGLSILQFMVREFRVQGLRVLVLRFGIAAQFYLELLSFLYLLVYLKGLCQQLPQLLLSDLVWHRIFVLVAHLTIHLHHVRLQTTQWVRGRRARVNMMMLVLVMGRS